MRSDLREAYPLGRPAGPAAHHGLPQVALLQVCPPPSPSSSVPHCTPHSRWTDWQPPNPPPPPTPFLLILSAASMRSTGRRYSRWTPLSSVSTSPLTGRLEGALSQLLFSLAVLPDTPSSSSSSSSCCCCCCCWGACKPCPCRSSSSSSRRPEAPSLPSPSNAPQIGPRFAVLFAARGGNPQGEQDNVELRGSSPSPLPRSTRSTSQSVLHPAQPTAPPGSGSFSSPPSLYASLSTCGCPLPAPSPGQTLRFPSSLSLLVLPGLLCYTPLLKNEGTRGDI